MLYFFILFFLDGGTPTQSVVYSAVLPFSIFHLLKAFGEGECFEAFFTVHLFWLLLGHFFYVVFPFFPKKRINL